MGFIAHMIEVRSSESRSLLNSKLGEKFQVDFQVETS